MSKSNKRKRIRLNPLLKNSDCGRISFIGGQVFAIERITKTDVRPGGTKTQANLYGRMSIWEANIIW